MSDKTTCDTLSELLLCILHYLQNNRVVVLVQLQFYVHTTQTTISRFWHIQLFWINTSLWSFKHTCQAMQGETWGWMLGVWRRMASCINLCMVMQITKKSNSLKIQTFWVSHTLSFPWTYFHIRIGDHNYNKFRQVLHPYLDSEPS